MAGIFTADQTLSWIDQAVVSATGFMTLVILGRYTDAAQLGAYAVAGSAIALFLSAQEALITRPYAIQLHRPVGTPEEHAFGSMLMTGLLAAFGSALLGLISAGLLVANEATTISAALAGVISFILLREFARRFGFAHLRMGQVLALDVTVAVINLLLLVLLARSGSLSAFTALVALGVSCAFGFGFWLIFARSSFAFRLTALPGTLKQSWQLGKWLLCGQLAIQIQAYATYWLSLLFGGAALTGIYAACMSIVAFVNPVLFGFYNILTPRSVRVFHRGGGLALRRDAIRNSLLIASLVGPICVLLAAFGDDVLRLIFASDEYAGNGGILTVLAFSCLAAAIGAPASIALAAAERARAVAAVMGATALLSVLLVWWSMSHWGLLGAAYGILIAELLGSLGRWSMLLLFVAKATKERMI